MIKLRSTHLLFTTFTALIITGLATIGYAKEDGSPSGNTGSPGDDQTCARVDCHTGSASERAGLIATDVPASGYLVGETYLITVSIDEPGAARFGFQASPQNLDGDEMGEMSLINTTQTKFTGGGKYITHTSTGTAGTDSKSWTFNWTPEEATGDVTFYVAVNAADNDDEATGDKIFTSSVRVSEDPDNIPLSIEEMNDITFDVNGITNENLSLTIASPQNTAMIIHIIDMQGRAVVEKQYAFTNGNFNISTAELNAGMYFVRISNEQGAIAKQFVIH
jgi:hypothetical protein